MAFSGVNPKLVWGSVGYAAGGFAIKPLQVYLELY
jgi:hypothetical protein